MTIIAKPIFRNPDKFQILSYREWMREHMPNGKFGFVVEDVDLVIRWYGENFKQDATGAFMLVELKFGDAELGIAQNKTFGLMDRLLRLADPKKDRYLGYFLLQYSDEDWDKATFKINRDEVTRQQFESFLKCEYRPASYFELGLP